MCPREKGREGAPGTRHPKLSRQIQHTGVHGWSSRDLIQNIHGSFHSSPLSPTEQFYPSQVLTFHPQRKRHKDRAHAKGLHARGQKRSSALRRARAALITQRPAHASTHATGARYPPLPYAPRSRSSSTYIIYLMVCGCRATCVHSSGGARAWRHSSGGARAWRGCGVQATPYPPRTRPKLPRELLPPPAPRQYPVSCSMACGDEHCGANLAHGIVPFLPEVRREEQSRTITPALTATAPRTRRKHLPHTHTREEKEHSLEMF